MSERHSQAQRDRRLTEKEAGLVRQFARIKNGTKAAKLAGYQGNDNVLGVTAHRTLKKPKVKAALEREMAIVQANTDFSAGRVRRRLDALSHGAEGAEQFGVAVRAEELLGKAAGMFVDQSISLTATLSGEHLQALVQVARQRQAQPLDLGEVKPRDRLLDE